MTLPDARALAQRVAGHLGASAATHADAIASWLSPTLAELRDRWPQIQLSDEAFADHLGRCLAEGADPIAALAELRADDLYLACACGHGDAHAIEVLTERCRPTFARVFANPSAQGVDAEDLQQVLLSRLLLGSPLGAPKILDYTGRGRLTTWIKVAATRLRIDSERRRSDKGSSLDDSSLHRIEQSMCADMELSLLKQHYQATFKEAFQQSLRELQPEQRNLLRLTLVEGLSATGIARLRGVHRATAKRWLVQVRAQLLEDTERNLARRLGLNPEQLDTILGMVRSGLEVSMQRYLVDEAEA